MKNISPASLISLCYLSLVFSFVASFNTFDAQHIFSINTALAASTSTADLSGTVFEGDMVSVDNPGKGGVTIELYNSGPAPIQIATASDGTFSAVGVTDITSVCIGIPSGYQLNNTNIGADGCYYYDPIASGNIANIDFTIGLVPADVQASSTLNIMGKITADAWALTPIPAGLVTIEIRDGANTLATTTTNDRSGLFSVSVVPAAYTACIIVPGGYGLITGERCQSVALTNADVTLNDVMLSTFPVMTRNGESTMTIDHGASYIDAGATAAKDGRDLTDLIQVSGLPDTNVAGLYVITYAVTDPNTSLSATTTRLVTVAPKHEVSHAGNGGVIGGSYVGTSYAATAAPITPAATTSTTTLNTTILAASDTLALSGAEGQSKERKAQKEYLRQRALGNVLGAETEASGTSVTISTSALEKIPETAPLLRDYLKPIFALLAFGGVIAGGWWWKKRSLN